MAKRTINELIDSDFKFVDAVNYQRLQVALRDVKESAPHTHTCQRVRQWSDKCDCWWSRVFGVQPS